MNEKATVKTSATKRTSSPANKNETSEKSIEINAHEVSEPERHRSSVINAPTRQNRSDTFTNCFGELFSRNVSADGMNDASPKLKATAQQQVKTVKCTVPYRIPLPVCKLRYYHGIGKKDNFIDEVPMKGDFLLFLNAADNNKPTLLVRDENKDINIIPIGRDKNEHFYLVPGDLQFSFTSVGTLIEHYSGEAVPENYIFKGIILRRPVICSEYNAHLLIEPKNNLKTWTYRMPENTLADHVYPLLKRSGDFVLIADKPERNQVFVRWNNEFKILSFSPNEKGQWILPRRRKFEPMESVQTLDHLIKSLVKIRHVIDGVCLIKPMKVKVTKDQAEQSMSVNTDDHRDSNAAQQAIRLPTEESGTNLENQAPRPLHTLPFYLGKKKFYKAFSYLKNSGDYVVFINSDDKCPYLATCIVIHEEMIYHCCKIRKTDSDYFILIPSDAENAFGTIEELVKYYEMYHLPLQTTGPTPYSSAILKQPAPDDAYAEEFKILDRADFKTAQWKHRPLKIVETDAKLKKSGDFLLRQGKHEQDCVITARWGTDYWDMHVKPDKRGMFTLARSDPMEPIEYAKDFREFVKSAILGMTQFNQIVLKHYVTSDSDTHRNGQVSGQRSTF